LCGKSLDTLLIDQPGLVGHTLPGGRVISEGADNEMHCVCFTCIGKMTTAQNFLVQYNDCGKPSYSHHAFEQVDDFADAADFASFPTTEWENAKRKFEE
jgi:hypothetical protein